MSKRLLVPVGKVSGTPQRRGMTKHCFLAAGGIPHFDGWTCCVERPERDQLLAELECPGAFYFLVHENLRLKWQFRVTDALFLEGQCGVCHRDRVHGDVYRFRTLLLYAGARRIRPSRHVGELQDAAGGPLQLPRSARDSFAYARVETWMGGW